jgi:hypothetical protein
MVASWWLHYGVNKFLWVFIKYQIVSYVLNSTVEILLVLTYDLGSTGWLDLKCWLQPVWLGFWYTFMANLGQWIMSKNTIVILIYHCHKLLNHTYINNEHTRTTETQNKVIIKKAYSNEGNLNSFQDYAPSIIWVWQ